MNKCPECGSKDQTTIVNSGELICKKCGLVLDDMPFETNPYVSDAEKRTAEVPYLARAGTQKINGKFVKNSWLMSTREKNMRTARRRLGIMSSKLNLCDKVKQEAYFLFKLAVDKELNVGRDNLSILYACVYGACKLHQMPKTPSEIINRTSLSRTKLLRAYSLIRKGLGLKIGITNMDNFIPRFSSRLELKQTTITKVYEIVNKLEGNPVIAGKHPKTIVASAIYLATIIKKDTRTQREITNATRVIEVTIRKRSKEIADELGIEV